MASTGLNELIATSCGTIPLVIYISMFFFLVHDCFNFIGNALSHRSLELNHQNNFDGLVQERRISIANALELRLSCTNPSI